MVNFQVILVLVVSFTICVRCDEGRRSNRRMPLCLEEDSSEVADGDNPDTLPSEERCEYTTISQDGQQLFTKTLLDEAFANVSAKSCPAWSSSKDCFRNYLNRKCNSNEKEMVQGNINFNALLVMSEVLCNPPGDINLLNLFKRAVDLNIGDCLVNTTVLEGISECWTATNNRTFELIPFREAIPVMFECAIKPLKDCANGHVVMEVLSISLWNELERATLETYDAAWNQLNKVPSRILDFLK